MGPPIAIIVNPVAGGVRAGKERDRAELAATIARRLGLDAEIAVTRGRGHASDLAAAAAARGVSLVVAWGGDGTLNEVAAALAFGEVPLAIVPAGSGNGFARELHVDLRPERAIEDAIRAVPRAIDIGELGGRLFVNIAGIGFDAHVAEAFDDRQNRRRGILVYAALTARALATYRADRYAISTPAGRTHVRALLVTLANSSQYGNHARIAPDARIDDGLLDLVVFEETTRWRTACALPQLFTGTLRHATGYMHERVDRLTIESDRPMMFHVDGEPVHGGTTLGASVHPGALKLAVR